MKLTVLTIILLALAASTAAIDGYVFLKTTYCEGNWIACFNLGPDVHLLPSYHFPR
jgi:hypothetical protein